MFDCFQLTRLLYLCGLPSSYTKCQLFPGDFSMKDQKLSLLRIGKHLNFPKNSETLNGMTVSPTRVDNLLPGPRHHTKSSMAFLSNRTADSPLGKVTDWG
jgi:hypothetical protein